MALLDGLDKIDKRNGLGKAHLVANEDLAHYVQTQIDEMKVILTRLRVDVLLNEEISVDGQSEADARDEKVKKLQKDIKQMAEAVTVLTKLKDELNK